MKKSAAAGGAVVVLVVAWLGATWYTGKRLETESPARIAVLNQQLAQALPGYGVKVEQLSFDRGFFSSHARYGISVVGQGREAGQPVLPSGVIEIDVTADHGPFPLKALEQGSVAPKLAYVHAELAHTDKLKPLFDAAQGKAPLSSDEVVSYSGASDGTIDLAPLHIKDDSGELTFSGATAQGSYSPSTQAAHVVMQMASIALDMAANPASGDKGGQVRVEGVQIKGDTHLGKSKLSVGNTELSIKHLGIKVADEHQITLDDVHQVTDTHEDGDTLGGQVSYRIGAFKANGADLGKGQLVLKLAGMNSATAYTLTQAYGRFAAQVRQKAAADRGGAAAPTPDPTELMTALRAALAGSPTVSIDPLLWQNDKGESRITANMVLKEPGPSPTNSEMMRTFMLQAIKSLDAKAILSQPMVTELAARFMTAFQGVPADQANQQAARQITGLAGMGQMMGVLRSDGGNLVSEFHYADGKMLLNGHDPQMGGLLPPGLSK